MNYLRSLKHWDRGFESHLRHGCLCAVTLCLCWSPFKESYRLCKRSRSWKTGQGPTKGRRAIDRYMKCLCLWVKLNVPTNLITHPGHRKWSVTFEWIRSDYVTSRNDDTDLFSMEKTCKRGSKNRSFCSPAIDTWLPKNCIENLQMRAVTSIGKASVHQQQNCVG
jgi:hypothetical protein